MKVLITEKEGEGLDCFEAVKSFYESFGYSVLDKPDLEDNGYDMYVVGKKKAIRVEIKSVQVKTNGTWQAAPVTAHQREADVCAVVFPNGAVLVERMSDYLKSCSPEGYRSFTWLKL